MGLIGKSLIPSSAEGLAFVAGTNELCAAVNETDDILYPFRNSLQDSGWNDYGKRITSYIDDHPPDEFIHVKEGANYGWPFANPNPDTPNGLDNMPLAPNYQTNPDWSKYPESMFTRIDKGIQAHSAPLGIAFLQDSKMPEPFREGIAIALREKAIAFAFASVRSIASGPLQRRYDRAGRLLLSSEGKRKRG
jgi:hypothetical protein